MGNGRTDRLVAPPRVTARGVDRAVSRALEKAKQEQAEAPPATTAGVDELR